MDASQIQKGDREAKTHRRIEPWTLIASLGHYCIGDEVGQFREPVGLAGSASFSWRRAWAAEAPLPRCWLSASISHHIKLFGSLFIFSWDYRTRLAKFISNSLQVFSHGGNIKCPCAKCLNRFWLSNNEVEAHLIVEGMDRSYLEDSWVWHGETFGDPLPSPLLEDIFSGPSVMGGMPINNHSRQKASIPAYALFQNKCLYGCSESAVQASLQLLKHILPNGHSLPKNMMSTKGLLKNFMLPHQKIHAYENDCMLYWKHNSGLDVCHICGVSKYTTEVDETAPSSKKIIPRKVLTYFPITPRLQRLYMSRHTSEDMCWHGFFRFEDGFLRHPTDSFAWKQLDLKFPTFGGETRNVHLALVSDGFNLFGKCSTNYSTWPLLLVVYNLPPWLCMKAPFILMAFLLLGKESPGNDIDVLWTSGVPTYDTFRQETFTLRASVFTHGKLACPHCNYKTESTYLKKGRKYCYIGHRRFLPMSHVFHRQRKTFSLSDEREQAPSPLTGCECRRRLSILRFKYVEGFRKLTLKIVMILCQLEMILSPTFFVVSLHLTIHLLQVRCTIDGYTQLKEGSMTQGYLAKECLSFCAMYLEDRIRPDHEGDFDIFCATDDIDFIFTYRSYVENAQKTRGGPIKSFPYWFEKHVSDRRATDDLVALANGPSKWCRRYKIFVCNGFRFKVRDTQSNGKYQNYGVFLQSDVPSYAGPRDRNPVTGLIDFYRVLTDVFEIKYHTERTVDVEHATGDNDEVRVRIDLLWVSNNNSVASVSIDEGVVDERQCMTCTTQAPRRINRPRWAPNGTKELMKFNEKGQPVLRNASSRSIIFSNNVVDWRHFYRASNMDRAWQKIKEQVNGSKPDRITFFTLTHTRKSGEPVDARSAIITSAYTLIINLGNNLQDEFNTNLKLYEDRNEIIIDEVRHIVYADVLGPERDNRVRGFGTGVVWSDVPGIITKKRGICREVEAIRASYEEQRKDANFEIKRLKIEVSSNVLAQLRKEYAESMVAHNRRVELEVENMKCEMRAEIISALKRVADGGMVEPNRVDVTQVCVNRIEQGNGMEIQASGESNGTNDEIGYRPCMVNVTGFNT
ncbi:hypothetical protein D8674_004377 [Pyrus ussuriensis x Pyrus communis]|uniref:Transposase-associated domain-containing protein n=1 Tax=Pyrus ussuriensis x Pyrus communis TaxID=2448454 RepID=A0A5N5FQ46_9ROSA|nr:hypothetical protein D8674_004377 [Pyrus ussuriensis x Pyrus communis]